ncbi:MAG: oligosaccharide flippase family protein, partial [Chthoniobacterales bacterium]
MALISSFRVYWANAAAQNRAWANMGWLFTDRVLRSGLGLLVLIWMARHLGPAQFGVLNYATAYVALIWSFTDLGLSSIVVRNLVKRPEDAQRILGTAFFLRLGAVILGWSAALTGIGWLRPADTVARTLVTILATGMLFQVCDTLAWWFEALVQSKHIAWARSGAFLLSAALRVALIISRAPLSAFALASAIELAVTALGVVTVFVWRRNSATVRLSFTWAFARSLLCDSWPLIFSNLAIVIYMRLDQVMLGNMRGD